MAADTDKIREKVSNTVSNKTMGVRDDLSSVDSPKDTEDLNPDSGKIGPELLETEISPNKAYSKEAKEDDPDAELESK